MYKIYKGQMAVSLFYKGRQPIGNEMAGEEAVQQISYPRGLQQVILTE